MTTHWSYSADLPFGGKLQVSSDSWRIYYFFSPPGTHWKKMISATVRGELIDEYIRAYKKCWNEFQQITQNPPSMGKLWNSMPLGMSVSRDGVCIDYGHMPITEQAQLDKLLDSFELAKRIAAEAQQSYRTAMASLPTDEISPARSNGVSDGFDPYASQRHMRGRKSHLAAAITQNIHDHPFMGVVWTIIFVILLVGSFVLGVMRK